MFIAFQVGVWRMHERKRGGVGPPVRVYWNGKWQLADILWCSYLGTFELSLRFNSRIVWMEADSRSLRLTDDWVGRKVQIYHQRHWRSAWVGQVRRNGRMRVVLRDGFVCDNVVVDEGLRLLTARGWAS